MRSRSFFDVMYAANDDTDSFGVLLFEMFCGQLPFLSKSPLELVHCHIAARPPSPERVTLHFSERQHSCNDS
jgi:serine/threonine protein kinase